MGAVIEGDAQPHIGVGGVGEDVGGERGHSRQGDVAEPHGEQASHHIDCHAIRLPVGLAAIRINEGEVELADAVEAGATDRDPALVIDDLRHLGNGRQGEKHTGGKSEDGFHGATGKEAGLTPTEMRMADEVARGVHDAFGGYAGCD